MPYLTATTNTTKKHAEIIVYHDSLTVKFSQASGGSVPRGTIIEFSAKSQNRLRYLLSQVRWSRCYFITLTYHQFDVTSKQVSHDIHKFTKRLQRQYPGCSLVWKKEIHETNHKWHVHAFIFNPPSNSKANKELEAKSAIFEQLRREYCVENNKKYKPHNWLRSSLDQFKLWLSYAWHEVTGETDPRHLLFAVNTKPVRNPSQVQAYCAKYISKSVELERWEDEFGRFWGYSRNLDKRPYQRRVISLHAGLVLRDMLIKYLKTCAGYPAQFALNIEQLADEYGKLGFTYIGGGRHSKDKNIWRMVTRAIVKYSDQEEGFYSKRLPLATT